MRRRTWIGIGGVAVLAAVVGTAVLVWWQGHPVHRFGVVEPGVLYRSAQPLGSEWEVLWRHYGIKTVFDLRSDQENKQWAITEREFCQRHGIDYVIMPVGPDRLTDAQLKQFVETVADPSHRPVLVHCELGRSRTGVVVAAYRIVAQGWSYDAAVAESQQYKETMEPGYAAYLKELAGGQGWRPNNGGGHGNAPKVKSMMSSITGFGGGR